MWKNFILSIFRPTLSNCPEVLAHRTSLGKEVNLLYSLWILRICGWKKPPSVEIDP